MARRDKAVMQVLFFGLARLFRAMEKDHGFDRRAGLSKDYHFSLSSLFSSRCEIADQSNLHSIPCDDTNKLRAITDESTA